MLLCCLCSMCSCAHVVIGNMNIQHCYNDLSQRSVVFHSGLKARSSQSQSDLCSGQPKQSQRYNGWHIELFKIHDSLSVHAWNEWKKKKKKPKTQSSVDQHLQYDYNTLYMFLLILFLCVRVRFCCSRAHNPPSHLGFFSLFLILFFYCLPICHTHYTRYRIPIRMWLCSAVCPCP